jgi:hypothetical protein
MKWGITFLAVSGLAAAMLLGASPAATASTDQCFASLQEAGAGRTPWVSGVYSAKWVSPGKPDRRYVDYLPELTWEEFVVSPTGNCTDSQKSVFISNIERQGAGQGYVHVAWDRGRCSTKRICMLLFGDKKYDLNKKDVREALYCQSVPYVWFDEEKPFITEDIGAFGQFWPYLATAYGGEGLFLIRPYQANYPDLKGWFAAPMYEDLCIPVPKKPATYRMQFIGQEVGFKFPSHGWVYTCRKLVYSTVCSWEFDGPSSYGFEKSSASIDVVVKPNSVTFKNDRWGDLRTP